MGGLRGWTSKNGVKGVHGTHRLSLRLRRRLGLGLSCGRIGVDWGEDISAKQVVNGLCLSWLLDRSAQAEKVLRRRRLGGRLSWGTEADQVFDGLIWG